MERISSFVDETQYRALVRHLRPDLRVVVALGYTSGLRGRSEVLPLEWRHVDLDAGTVRLEPGTTREGRLVYLTPEVKHLLAEQRGRVEALGRKLAKERGLDHVIVPFVFPHLNTPHRGERITEFRKAWRKACRAAGLLGLLIHDLRRSNLERAGVARSVAERSSPKKKGA